jgi:hypothetical protein
MKLKHKVIKEFQFLTDDKKILILKINTVLEEYVYSQKDESIVIDKDIVDKNPEFFQEIDWRAELLSYLKTNKIPQSAVLSKKLFPFVEDLLKNNSVIKEEVIVNETKELEIKKREKKIISDEEDIEIRLKRLEKREEDYKKDVLILKQKEEELKDKLIELDSINERESKLKNYLEFKSEVEEYNEYLISKLKEVSNWWYQTEPYYIHLSRLGIPNFPTIEYQEIKKTS